MFIKGISNGERGNLGPYFSLFTTIISFGNKAFFMEELGILNIPKMNVLRPIINEMNTNNLKTALSSFLK